MRSRILFVLAAVATVVCSCAVPAEDAANVLDRNQVPFGLLDPDSPRAVSATEGQTEPVTLCLVRDGQLEPTERALESPVDPIDAIDALAAPSGPDSPGTDIGEPSLVRDVVVAAGVARVDLRPSISVLPSGDQALAVAQIVCTLTARPGIGQVTFTVEGSPVDVPRADGSLASEAVSREDYESLLP